MNLAFRRWLHVGLGGLVLWLGDACTQSPTSPPSPTSQARPIRSNTPSMTLWQSYYEAAIQAGLKQDDVEFEQQCWAALREAEGFGPTNPLLVPPLAGLGALYEKQGRNAEAEPLLRRALAIKKQTPGLPDGQTTTILWSLGKLYLKQNKYAEAEPFFRHALATCEKILTDHPEDSLCGISPPVPIIPGILGDYAVLLRQTNRPTEATALEARAKDILTAFIEALRSVQQRQGRPKVP